MSNDLKEKFDSGELLLLDNSSFRIPLHTMQHIFSNTCMLNVRRVGVLDNDIYMVFVDGKQFHINSNWEPLYEERYDSVWEYVNNIARAQLDHKQFHIGKDGKPLYEERYDKVCNFIMGAATVELDGKQFHIGKAGKPLYEERYDRISWLYDDIFVATLDDKQFHVGLDGKPLYTERYDTIDIFRDGMAKAYLDSKEYIIDKSGSQLQFETIEEIGSRDDTLYIISTNDGYIFETGCFHGTIDEFDAAVKRTHEPETKPYFDYMTVIERYRGEK